MCGIAGYVGRATIDAEHIRKCLSLMHRRGPDSSGYYQDNFGPGWNAYLLHTRLSIIDLDERAGQPFKLDSRVFIFNGELYNYLELKRELQSRGHRFVTTSDTEVFLHALQEDLDAALDACEGMWAAALYDAKTGALTLMRDRFGEKPLFLYQDATGLYFGSEVKFIAALVGQPLAPDYDQIFRYLVNGYKSLYKQPGTFFQNVVELGAGEYLITQPDSRPIRTRYWTPGFEQDDKLSYADAVEGVRTALIRSVKMRLRADVPLAFCMSGGVDSNALISIAKNEFDYDVHGFTIVNRDERYAEQDLVDYAIAELSIKNTAIVVNTDNFIENLRTLIAYHDAPVATITYYAHWLLMESIAAHGYKISVSGTAADELFTGYYYHHNFYLATLRDDPPLFTRSLANWKEHIAPIVRNPILQDPEAFIKDPGQRAHIYLYADRFAGYLKPDFQERFLEEHYCDDLLRNRMLNELFHESIPVILHEDDHNAMYFSIENRSPFLDRHLFEFCARIPSRHLIKDGFGKSILRDAMRGITPPAILNNRRKVGFNAPIFSFLDIQVPDVRAYLLDDSPIFDYCRKEKIEQLINKDELPNSESKFLFYFLSCKMFLEEFAA